VKHSIGREESLRVTILALILPPRADEPGLIMLTPGIVEAIGPLVPDEISQIITLGAKPVSELSWCRLSIHTVFTLYR
jgi:hypothetical protein